MQKFITTSIFAIAALIALVSYSSAGDCTSTGGHTASDGSTTLICGGLCPSPVEGFPLSCSVTGDITDAIGTYKDCACGGVTGTPTDTCCHVVETSSGFDHRGTCTSCGTGGTCGVFTTGSRSTPKCS